MSYTCPQKPPPQSVYSAMEKNMRNKMSPCFISVNFYYYSSVENYSLGNTIIELNTDAVTYSNRSKKKKK